jgi:hypothetical protein
MSKGRGGAREGKIVRSKDYRNRCHNQTNKGSKWYSEGHESNPVRSVFLNENLKKKKKSGQNFVFSTTSNWEGGGALRISSYATDATVA